MRATTTANYSILSIVIRGLLLLGLIAVSAPSVVAEDCLLEENDNTGTQEYSTGGAESDGDDFRLACGRSATATGDFSTAVGNNAAATGQQSTAIGRGATATEIFSTAVSQGTEATGRNSTAVGNFATADALSATALGAGADATQRATAVGGGAGATALRSTAIGSETIAQSVGATALGFSAEIRSTDSTGAMAIGYRSVVGAAAHGAIAIGGDADSDGVGAQATAANAIALGADVVADIADNMFVGVPVRVVPPSVGVSEKVLMRLENNGGVNFKLNDTSGGNGEWTFRTGSQGSKFVIGKTGTSVQEFQVFSGGNVSIAGTLTQSSSRTNKENIETINHEDILAKVTALPIHQWNYIHDNDDIRHIGPMAEDFHSLFDVGTGPKGISSIDTSGIALAAIQGLSHALKQTQQDMDKKDQQVQAIQQQLEQKEVTLEQQAQQIQSLQHVMKDKDTELAELRQHVASLQSPEMDKNAVISHLQEQVATLQAQQSRLWALEQTVDALLKQPRPALTTTELVH